MNETDLGHPVNDRIWPHLCGVCRSPNATKCSACKSFAFCGKDHQKKAWKKHKRVCRFLKRYPIDEKESEVIEDGVDGVGLGVVAYGVFERLYPVVVEGADDATRLQCESEKNQITNVPRCLCCGTLPPLSIVCPCKAVAFCSEECERKCKDEDYDFARHPQMLCDRLKASVAALPILMKEGWSPGMCSQVGKTIHLVEIADDAEAEYSRKKDSGLKTDKVSKYELFSIWRNYFDQVNFRISDGMLGGAGTTLNNNFDPAFATVVADGLSNSLTICYALEKAGKKYSAYDDRYRSNDRQPLANEDNLFTIHIIGVEMEWQGFGAFEEVLHRLLFNELSKNKSILPKECRGLRVVMIGPEIMGPQDGSVHDESKMLCDHCSKKKMKMRIEFHTQIYEDFVQSDKSSKPDVMVAFNCGIHDKMPRKMVNSKFEKQRVEEKTSAEFASNYTNAWRPCIEMICESPNGMFNGVPFILTGFDMHETNADEEVACSFEKDGFALKPIVLSEENPFQSPIWQPEPVWHRKEGKPVAFAFNFALTVLERKKNEI